MQRRQSQQRGTPPPQPPSAKVVHLQSVRQIESVGYAHFGALLRSARTDAHVTQQHIAEAFAQYATEAALAELDLRFLRPLKKPLKLTRKQIGKLEDDLRAPAFDELLPLYLALTAGSGSGMTDAMPSVGSSALCVLLYPAFKTF